MQDYAAPWFRARRQRGIDDTIYYGMIEPAKQRRHVFSVPHEHCDGVGAFMRLLRRLPVTSWQGVSGRPAPIPSLRECWRKQRAASLPAAPCWRQTTPAADAGRQHIALGHFSLVETQALRSEAKHQSVSLNALLLSALHHLVTAQLLSQGGGGWFVPVTLRGALSLSSDEMNHASGVYLSLPAQTSSVVIQQQLTEAIRRDEHWWLWHQSRLVVNLGGQWLVNRLLGWLGQRRYLGSFSSMGEWNIDWRGSGLADDTLMWGCPPGSPNYPVSACWSICNGRLLFVLKLNAALGLSAARCEALMQSWQRSVLSLLSPANAGIEMTESCDA